MNYETYLKKLQEDSSNMAQAIFARYREISYPGGPDQAAEDETLAGQIREMRDHHQKQLSIRQLLSSGTVRASDEMPEPEATTPLFCARQPDVNP
jgi:hypothetical protein